MLKVSFTKNFSGSKSPNGKQFPRKLPSSTGLNLARRTPDLDIHFQVNLGLTVLFGPSGCGKTSTLKAIAGLLHPDRGAIEVSGVTFLNTDQLLYLSPHQRHVGYVFQNCALFPHLNVAENIGFALNRWPGLRRQQRVDELLHLLELDGLAKASVQSLSGGQAQRIAIARAIAPDPKILLLDEPFSSLDDRLRASLRTELKIIQRQFNLPVVLVTHSRTDALDLADCLVTLAAGRVVNVGEAQQLLDSRSHHLPTNFLWG